MAKTAVTSLASSSAIPPAMGRKPYPHPCITFLYTKIAPNGIKNTTQMFM